MHRLLGHSLLGVSTLLTAPLPPHWAGDPEAVARLEAPLTAALEATAGFGPMPTTPWYIQVHADAGSFEQASGASPQRAACWVGATLHLRPWEQLRRRDLGSLLRHELTHRRLSSSHLRRWEEEARCLWAEQHLHPAAWPMVPAGALQDRLDLALARGGTELQAWAYACLRAWLEGAVLPREPERSRPAPPVWESAEGTVSSAPKVRVRWPEERLPKRMVVNGAELPRRPGFRRTFQGEVRFGAACPVRTLPGPVELRCTGAGWSLVWETDPGTWVASATAGELGEAPLEAKRALAAVLARWLEGHREGQHPDGTLCPLTHCAVVRGTPGTTDRRAAVCAPPLVLDPQWAFFTGSSGGHPLSPREVWGQGPERKGEGLLVSGDRWGHWERSFSAPQVRHLKASVKPGLAPGQLGLRLGPSGPYPVEELRLAAGRAFGWTAWPSNACEAKTTPEGGLRVEGHGWGHNVGLCLSSAIDQAKQGIKAEEILARAFPGSESLPLQPTDSGRKASPIQ